MNEEPLLYSTLMETLGAELVEWTPGRVRWAITVAPWHSNPGGVVQGGVMATLLDEAVANAVTSLRGYDVTSVDPHLVVDMNVSFIAAARPGERLEVEGQVLQLGRQVAFGEAEARRQPDGALVAKGRFTFIIP